MKKLLVIFVLTFTSKVFALETERGVLTGADCDEIRVVEAGLRSQELTNETHKVLIGFTGLHRKFKAKIIYTCTEEKWMQSIHYGSFHKGEAIEEATTYLRELEEKYGSSVKLIDTWKLFPRLLLWFKDRNSYKQMKNWWVWNKGDKELALQIQPSTKSSQQSQNKWNIIFSTSSNLMTECLDKTCENLRIRDPFE